jgi:2-polyprenyl-3-methyl-5-hydroxy-6-metoxy-1,4-benzoquinol methylase
MTPVENPLARYRVAVLEAWAVRSAVEAGIFELLSEPRRIEWLVDESGFDRSALAPLLDSLVVTGQLVRAGDEVAIAPSSRRFVLRSSPEFIGDSLGFLTTSHHFERYPDILAGAPAVDPGDAGWKRMTRGSAAYAKAAIPALLSRHPELASEARSVLDVGCGQGDFSIALATQNPALRVLGIDPTEAVAEVARERARAHSIRIEHARLDEVTESFDAVFFNHVLHIVGEEIGSALLRDALPRTNPGGRVFVQELVTDDAPEVALFGLTMRLHFEGGRVFRTGEIAALLTAAGYEAVERIHVPAPTRGLVFLTGRRPH